MKEIWKNIKNYEGLYQISNLGNIKSLKRFHRTSKEYSSIGYIRKEKILNPIKNKNGYFHVSLCKNGKRKIYFIHKLVAETFLKNENNYKFVNHKDENKLNNSVENLEWCDAKYNCNYGNRNKKISNKLKIKIEQYDLNGNFIKQWESASDAAKKLQINRSHIGNCINHTRKTTGGFIWKKVEKK